MSVGCSVLIDYQASFDTEIMDREEDITAVNYGNLVTTPHKNSDEYESEDEEIEDAFDELFGRSSETKSSLTLVETLMQKAALDCKKIKSTDCTIQEENTVDNSLQNKVRSDSLDETAKNHDPKDTENKSLPREPDHPAPASKEKIDNLQQLQETSLLLNQDNPAGVCVDNGRNTNDDTEGRSGKTFSKNVPMHEEQTWDFSLQALNPNFRSKCLWLEGTAYQKLLGECLHEMHNVTCCCKEKKKVAVCRICHTVFCSTKCFRSAMKAATTGDTSDNENAVEQIEAMPTEVSKQTGANLKSKFHEQYGTVTEDTRRSQQRTQNKIENNSKTRNASNNCQENSSLLGPGPPEIEKDSQCQKSRDGANETRQTKSRNFHAANYAKMQQAHRSIPPENLWPGQVPMINSLPGTITNGIINHMVAYGYAPLVHSPTMIHQFPNPINIPTHPQLSLLGHPTIPLIPCAASSNLLPQTSAQVAVASSVININERTGDELTSTQTVRPKSYHTRRGDEELKDFQQHQKGYETPVKILRNPFPRENTPNNIPVSENFFSKKEKPNVNLQQSRTALDNLKQYPSTTVHNISNNCRGNKEYPEKQKVPTHQRDNFSMHKSTENSQTQNSGTAQIKTEQESQSRSTERTKNSVTYVKMEAYHQLSAKGSHSDTATYLQNKKTNVGNQLANSSPNHNSERINLQCGSFSKSTAVHGKARPFEKRSSSTLGRQNYENSESDRQTDSDSYKTAIESLSGSEKSVKVNSNTHHNDKYTQSHASVSAESSRYKCSEINPQTSYNSSQRFQDYSTIDSRTPTQSSSKRPGATFSSSSSTSSSTYYTASNQDEFSTCNNLDPEISYGVRMPAWHRRGSSFYEFSIMTIQGLETFNAIHPNLQSCNKVQMTIFEVGNFCLTQYQSSDEIGDAKEWYRAVITKAIGKVGVYFLDLGVCTVVSPASVFELPTDFKKWKPLAIRMRCLNVQIDNEDDVQEYFVSLVRQGELKVRITHQETTEKFKYAGYLDVHHIHKWFDVGVLLKKFQVAEIGSENDLKNEEKENLLTRLANFDTAIFDRLLPKPQPPYSTNKISASITHVKSLNEFYVSTPELISQRRELENQLNRLGFAMNCKAVSCLEDLSFPLFMMIDEKSELWIRVKVIEVAAVEGPSSVVVQKLDYGDVLVVPCTKVKQLPEDLHFHATIYKCSLPVEPISFASKNLQLFEKSLGCLKELCDSRFDIKLQLFVIDNPSTHIVELFLDDTTSGCAHSFKQKGWVKFSHNHIHLEGQEDC